MEVGGAAGKEVVKDLKERDRLHRVTLTPSNPYTE